MKRARIIFGAVSFLALVTIANTLGTAGHGQERPEKVAAATPTPESYSVANAHSRFPMADFDSSESPTAPDREKRREKNERYDDQNFVMKRPHPDDSEVARYDEAPELPGIPVNESDLVIVGEILEARAFLSNDKSGIYSEFTIRIGEVLKSGTSVKIEPGESVSADRAGGYVRYPNGQKMWYRYAGTGMPQVGDSYVLFLKISKPSPNYQILTGYQLHGSGFNYLDQTPPIEGLSGAKKADLMREIKKKLSN